MCQVVWCALSFSPLFFYVASLISSPLTVTSPPHSSLYPFKCVSLSFCQILSSFLSSNFSCISPGVIGPHSTVDLRQIEDWEELTAVSVMRHGDKIRPGRLDGSLSQMLQAVSIVVVHMCFHRTQSLDSCIAGVFVLLQILQLIYNCFHWVNIFIIITATLYSVFLKTIMKLLFALRVPCFRKWDSLSFGMIRQI